MRAFEPLQIVRVTTLGECLNKLFCLSDYIATKTSILGRCYRILYEKYIQLHGSVLIQSANNKKFDEMCLYLPVYVINPVITVFNINKKINEVDCSAILKCTFITVVMFKLLADVHSITTPYTWFT